MNLLLFFWSVSEQRKKNSVSKIDAEIPFALPEGWEWCKLGSLCSSIQYGLSNSAESSGTHKLLRRITDIQNGSVNWDTVPYTTIEDPETFCCRNQGLQINLLFHL